MLIYKLTQVLTQERGFERKFSLLDAKKPHSQRKNGAIIFGKKSIIRGSILQFGLKKLGNSIYLVELYWGDGFASVPLLKSFTEYTLVVF